MFWNKEKQSEKRYDVTVHTYDGDVFNIEDCTTRETGNGILSLDYREGCCCIHKKDIKFFDAKLTK